jgi:hypothetical protein
MEDVVWQETKGNQLAVSSYGVVGPDAGHLVELNEEELDAVGGCYSDSSKLAN